MTLFNSLTTSPRSISLSFSSFFHPPFLTLFSPVYKFLSVFHIFFHSLFTRFLLSLSIRFYSSYMSLSSCWHFIHFPSYIFLDFSFYIFLLPSYIFIYVSFSLRNSLYVYTSLFYPCTLSLPSPCFSTLLFLYLFVFISLPL